MGKIIKLNDIEYEVINDYKEGLDMEALEEKFTDYFYDYTYVVGDWAYNKLRLKGFYDKNDPKCNKINNIENLENYINNNCAYGCRWFEIKKVNK
ncbi:MAG: YutD family protein [Bacilli bacterium]|nr:YutD family protein [Bacilli bacterium]